MARRRHSAINRDNFKQIEKQGGNRQLFRSLTVEEHLQIASRRRGEWTIERVYDTFPRLRERKSNRGNPNPTCEIHAHPVPQLLMFVGAEGSFEVEVPLNDEVYVLTKTTAIWIPAGVKHNVYYRRIDAPMMETGILMQGTYA